MKTKKQRFWEIDTLRGIAIIKMVISNFIFDLLIFGVYDFGPGDSLWAFSRLGLAAIIFIFLVGVSLTISYSRAKQKGKAVYSKYLVRGTRIFILGLIITIVTWMFFSKGTIYFGVLHFIGLAIILSVPLLRFRLPNLLLGISLIAAGIYLQSLSFDFNWLLWLGFIPHGFYTFDYFPLLPWFGLVLVGIFFGNQLYPNGRRNFSIPDLSRFRIISFFSFLGRKSLLIYLLHQPVIYAFLYLFVL